jgi:hypothetical protein
MKRKRRHLTAEFKARVAGVPPKVDQLLMRVGGVFGLLVFNEGGFLASRMEIGRLFSSADARWLFTSSGSREWDRNSSEADGAWEQPGGFSPLVANSTGVRSCSDERGRRHSESFLFPDPVDPLQIYIPAFPH